MNSDIPQPTSNNLRTNMATTTSATYTLPTSIFSLWVARGLNDLHGAEPTEPPTKTTKKRGRPVGSKNKTKAPTEAPKKRGRPVGSKNKAKVEAPKKRGRPVGSKNKIKDEPTETPTKTTKKRGRPVGSKNKIKDEPTETQASKRGRRPGSKNRHASKTKKNVAAATLIQQYWRTQMSGR